MELFGENSLRLKAVSSSGKKSSIIDVQLGSKYAPENDTKTLAKEALK